MQKVVIVDGTMELLSAVQPVLIAGRYDVVFATAGEGAYSSIKHERPALVILCLDVRERAGFQVLSMLKLDEDTRRIPLLTCLSEYAFSGARAAIGGGDNDDGGDDDALAAVPAPSLN